MTPTRRAHWPLPGGGGFFITLTTVDEIRSLVSEGSCHSRTIHFVNAYSVVCARTPGVENALSSATICVPDGVPVAAVAGRISGIKNAAATPGPQVMRSTLEGAGLSRRRHFFFGSTQDTLDALRPVVERLVPLANLAGFYSPPMSDDIDDQVDVLVRQLAGNDADVVWVGLGTPKQDLLLREMLHRDPRPVTYLGVGAAFDFLAGVQREAPAHIRGSGFEWLWRLASEPRRLWRRYLFGNAVFIKLAWGAFRRSKCI